MEPIEDSNFKRHDALALAVQFTKEKNVFFEEVIEIADEFLDWLNGADTDKSEVVFPNG